MADTKEKLRPTIEHTLPFEKRIVELEAEIEKAGSEEERATLKKNLVIEREQIFAELSPWQRVQLARHPLRPRMLNYTSILLDDLLELHGDHLGGEDPAVIGGIGRFQDRTIMVVGQQKGVSTEEKVKRNFGMAHPEGYRKAMRLFSMAERLKLPIVTFVDTPAAHPDIDAERHGQGSAIARSIWCMLGLDTPIFSVILGEGGSGGALGIAVGDRIAMFEHAIYVICPPERCAEILWKDVEKKELAATAMKVTAHDLLKLGVIDVVLAEPDGGAHRSPHGAAEELRKELAAFLQEADKGTWTSAKRRAKFRAMGIFEEVG